MSTVFYLSNATAAAVSPAFDAGWTDTSEAVRRALLRRKLVAESLALGTQIGPWTPGDAVLDRQYVSEPIAAQTVNGTIRAQLAAREHADDDNVTSHFAVHVFSNDGSTLRGTLLAVGQYGPATELINDASLQNKAFADGDALTPVAALAGDRIVVEFGYTDSTGATPEATARYGAPSATADHGINETDTAGLVPWVEFSMNIEFQTIPVVSNRTLESGFVTYEAHTPAEIPVISNRTLETGFISSLTGPFVINESPIGLSPCSLTETDVSFRIGAVSPRTVDLATVVVTINGIVAYDGGAGGFQSGFTGSVTDVSTLLEDLHDFVINPTDDFGEGVIVLVEVEGEDDLAAPIAPPVFWTFFTCTASMILDPPIYHPQTDTIRGGAQIWVTRDGVVIDTSADQTFQHLTTLPAGWSGSGLRSFDAHGVSLRTTAVAGNTSSIELATEFTDFDASIDCESILPTASVTATIALFSHTVDTNTVEVRAVREGDQIFVQATISAFDKAVISSRTPISDQFTLRIVRNGARVYTFVDSTALAETELFSEAAGTFSISVENQSTASVVRTRFSNFTIEPHARIGSRLLQNKSARFRHVVGTVPAATLPEVGTADVVLFGTFGESIANDGFVYTLPAERTIGRESQRTLVLVQDPVIKN